MSPGIKLYHLVVAVTAIGALAAGIMLIPRQDERVTMLARDGRYEEAAQLIETMKAAGDRRPQVLMQTLVLSVKQGDVAGGLRAARSYLALRPADTAAREMLAELLLHDGQLAEHMQVIGELLGSRPDADRLARLLALYRLHGHHDAELALLQRFAGSRHLGLAQLERLGGLLVARGDLEGAARVLRSCDLRAPAEHSAARLRLLHVLIELGRIDEAQRLAAAWLVQWRSPYLAGRLILRLAQGGAHAASASLARLSVERLPEATFAIAGVLTEHGQAAVARDMLARWSERTQAPTDEEIRGYVHASLAAGEQRQPLHRLLQLAHAGDQLDLQAALAEEIAYGYGVANMAPLLRMLAPEVLLHRPLLAAELARAAHDPALAGWYLQRIDPATLTAERQQLWLSLLRDVEPGHVVMRRLLGLWQRGQLHPTLLGELARDAGSAGMPALHDAIWASLAR